MSSRFRDVYVRYGIALALILLVLGMQSLLHRAVGNEFAVALLFMAILFAAWFGGFGPAALVSVAGLLSVGLLFPNEADADEGAYVGIVFYLLIAMGIALLGARMRSANDRAQRSAEELGAILSSIADAVLVTDASGQVLSLNPMAERLTGLSSSGARGLPLDQVLDLTHESTGAAAENPVRRALREGTVVALANQTVLRARDGTVTAIDASAAPMRGSDGAVTGVVMVFRDVSERRRTDEVRRRLAAIVESSNEAIIGQTLEGTITSWNAAAERLYGYSAEEIIGRHFSVLVPADREDEISAYRERLRQGGGPEGSLVRSFESVRRRKDGSLVDVLISYSPIPGEDGTFIGAAVIARDIGERKRAEEALREADRRKDEFLAMLAHELRNPLAPIRSGLDLLMLSGSGEDETLRLMQEQVTHLVRLVDDLLDVSRIVRGRVELRTEDVRLDELVHRVVEARGPAALSRNLTLHVEAPHPVFVIADRVRLTQVVDNLLSNATKYTEPGGRIDVSVCREQDEAVVRIHDNGIGIEPALLPRVFDLFTQSSRALDRAQGGLGIGLTLVRKLVEMHGGSIEAESPGLGQGSTFTVRMPAVEAPSREPPAPRQGPEPAVSRQILIVDDNASAARILTMLLSRLGDHRVRAVPDGPSALRAVQEQPPDLILLDIGLPGMDGYAVCRALRANGDAGRFVVAALTGYGREEDLRQSRAAGFDEHIVKPVSVTALRELLNHPKLRSQSLGA